MKKDLVVIDSKEFGLEENTANNIRAAYQPMLDKAVEIEDEYNKIISVDVTSENTSTFKELRLKIVKIRTGAVAIHKKEKEKYLSGGRFVDSWKNIFLLGLGDKESKLKEKEEHFINIEKEKIAELQNTRANDLIQYGEEHIPANLGTMDDNIWKNYISGVKVNHDRIEAAKAEEEKKRIAEEEAEAEERERIRIENEKLKKEAEAREKEEEKRKKKEEIERKAREDAEAKKEAEHQKQLKKERDEKERIETESRAREETERKAREDAEAKLKEERDRAEAEETYRQDTIRKEKDKADKERIQEEVEKEELRQAELNKGDKEKMDDLISSLNSITGGYEFKSSLNKKTYSHISKEIKSLVLYLEQSKVKL